MKSDPLITYRRRPATLDIDSLQSFAEVLRDRVARGREFHCRVSDDAELQSLNERFRGKDQPTDVLSFQVEESEAEPSLGDIAISIQRAREQAREWGHSTEDEIRILMLHGVLHLLGMDHESDSGEMQRTEIRWRRKFALPASLTERQTEGKPQ